MKRLVTILTTAMLLFCTALPAAASTLSVRADLWPPYNGDPHSDRPGYMIEVLREIFEPQGISIDYQILPWTRAVAEVRSGKVAALVGTDAEEEPGLVFPRENLGIHVNGFFVRTGNPWRFLGVGSLPQVRLGVIAGYSYGKIIDNYLAAAGSRNVTVATGTDPLGELLKMLMSGEIDVIVENVNVMNYARRERGTAGKGISVAGYEFIDKSALFVGFSPQLAQGRDYARRFDEGITQLRRDGRLDQILARYGLKDWK